MADVPNLLKRIVYPVDGHGRGPHAPGHPLPAGRSVKLLVDVYPPPELSAETRLSALFFLQGGPVPAEAMGRFESYGALAATSGLVGVTFDHPRSHLRSKSKAACFGFSRSMARGNFASSSV